MLLFLKNLMFTLLVPGTSAVCLPWLMIRVLPARSPGHVLIASILFLVGGMIYLWCLWDFATLGRGTPLPLNAPKRLVVRGLYRHTRNPMYSGVFTIILGWAVLLQTVLLLLYAFAVGAAFHLFIMVYEEPHPRRVFRAEYEAYSSLVDRWLPSVPPRSVLTPDRQPSGKAQPISKPDRPPTSDL